ncbi:hypothetical protein E4N62_46925 [Streptomyces sp. MNU76]|uniref:hypothetical protein n=1 Tax=Streptomyces sp. MNU76 TaxID=2560026 RepID=UPI001E563C69|nr:hypothetical protein [Streptomyces sp. MNU76]MCC9712092.1 hypothetical protein [Streptomyces sp. MNU76]
MDRAMLDRFITDWLARSLPPEKRHQAHADWNDQGVALLPLGARFSVVRLPERLVHAAVGSSNLTTVAETLTERLQGPVIRDTLAVGLPYYPLIQWHAGVVWENDEEAPCLGEGTYMGVPHISRVTPPGTYWLAPPRFEGDLCRPEAVQQLILRGRAVVADQAEAARA